MDSATGMGKLMDIAVPIGTYVASTYGPQYGQGAKMAADIWDTSKENYQKVKLSEALAEQADQLTDDKYKADKDFQGARRKSLMDAGNRSAASRAVSRNDGASVQERLKDISFAPSTTDPDAPAAIDRNNTGDSGISNEWLSDVSDGVLNALRATPEPVRVEFADSIQRMARINPEMALQYMANREQAIGDLKAKTEEFRYNATLQNAEQLAAHDLRVSQLREAERQRQVAETQQKFLNDMAKDAAEFAKTQHRDRMEVEWAQVNTDRERILAMAADRAERAADKNEAKFFNELMAQVGRTEAEINSLYERFYGKTGQDGLPLPVPPEIETRIQDLYGKQSDFYEQIRAALYGEDGNPVDPPGPDPDPAPGSDPRTPEEIAAQVAAAKARVAAGPQLDGTSTSRERINVRKLENPYGPTGLDDRLSQILSMIAQSSGVQNLPEVAGRLGSLAREDELIRTRGPLDRLSGLRSGQAPWGR